MKWAKLYSSLNILWHCPSLRLEWKLTYCWVFQICWHIKCSTLMVLYFRILSSSVGILSLPLALFVVMLPRAHLTSCSRMSGSRWVTIPLWVSVSLRHFSYSSSVYSYHVFLISSASVRSLPFLSFITPILAWNLPLISPRGLWKPWKWPSRLSVQPKVWELKCQKSDSFWFWK